MKITANNATFFEPSRCLLGNNKDSVRSHNAITAFFLKIFCKIVILKDDQGASYYINKKSLVKWLKNHGDSDSTKCFQDRVENVLKKQIPQEISKKSDNESRDITPPHSNNKIEEKPKKEEKLEGEGRVERTDKNGVPITLFGFFENGLLKKGTIEEHRPGTRLLFKEGIFENEELVQGVHHMSTQCSPVTLEGKSHTEDTEERKGAWKNGLLEGQGEISIRTAEERTLLEGSFEKGQLTQGKGSITKFKNGVKQSHKQGTFGPNETLNGAGTSEVFDEGGHLVSCQSGLFKEGKLHCECMGFICTYQNGNIIEDLKGGFQEGVLHGKGFKQNYTRDTQGKETEITIIFSNFVNGQPDGPTTIVTKNTQTNESKTQKGTYTNGVFTEDSQSK